MNEQGLLHCDLLQFINPGQTGAMSFATFLNLQQKQTSPLRRIA